MRRFFRAKYATIHISKNVIAALPRMITLLEKDHLVNPASMSIVSKGNA